MMGLALAALATGVVYIIIKMGGGTRDRNRRSITMNYDYTSYLNGKYICHQTQNSTKSINFNNNKL